MNNEKIVSFAQTKNRKTFGMVGIEVPHDGEMAYIRLAKQWSREEMPQMATDVKNIYSKVQWDITYADQLVGQHLLKEIEYASGINIFPITSQKNLKDPEDIEKIKVMDITEMTQLFLSLKLQHKIQYPNTPKNDMLQLIKQTEMFTEHTTESGNVSYYAPGEELDSLIKALLISCFAARNYLQEGDEIPIIVVGSSEERKSINIQDDFNKLMGKRKTNPLENYTSNITRF